MINSPRTKKQERVSKLVRHGIIWAVVATVLLLLHIGIYNTLQSECFVFICNYDSTNLALYNLTSIWVLSAIVAVIFFVAAAFAHASEN